MDGSMRISQVGAQSRYLGHMRNDMEQIGASIRALREQRNMSQSELARVLEIDESAVSKIETGKRGLAAAELAILSEHFVVAADAVLFPEHEDLSGALLRGDAGPDAERVKERVEQAFADLRYVRALVDS